MIPTQMLQALHIGPWSGAPAPLSGRAPLPLHSRRPNAEQVGAVRGSRGRRSQHLHHRRSQVSPAPRRLTPHPPLEPSPQLSTMLNPNHLPKPPLRCGTFFILPLDPCSLPFRPGSVLSTFQKLQTVSSGDTGHAQCTLSQRERSPRLATTRPLYGDDVSALRAALLMTHSGRGGA